MDKTALALAEENLDRAKQAVSRLEEAKSFKDIEEAWSDFLTAAHRIFSKLKEGAKANKASKSWADGKINQRRTQEHWRYIHHARNADEHGIRKVTGNTGFSLGIGPVSGIYKIDAGSDGSNANFNIQYTGSGTPQLSITTPTVQLVPVKDGGVEYKPPKWNPVEMTGPTPLACCREAFPLLEQMVIEAKALL